MMFILKINKIIGLLKKLIPRSVKIKIKKLINKFLIMKNLNKSSKSRKLNIGCGRDYKFGYINIDIDPSVKPDIVRDIEKGLPFDDNSVDEIYCSHTLEHIHDLLFVLREFYRVCKNKAKITIIVPLMDASDMTHVRFCDENTFRTLTDPSYWNNPYYFVGKYKEISRSFRKLETCQKMTLVLEVIK